MPRSLPPVSAALAAAASLLLAGAPGWASPGGGGEERRPAGEELTLAPLSFQPPETTAELERERRRVTQAGLDAAVAPWTVQLEPMLWYVSPGGRVRLPGVSDGGDQVRLDRLNLDSPRISAAGELHINARPWRFTFSGFETSLSPRGTPAETGFLIGDLPVSAGDPLDIRLEYFSAEATLGRLIYEKDFAADSEFPEAAVPMVLSLYALGGLRVHDFDLTVRNRNVPGAAAETQQFFLEPILGTRAELHIDRQFTIDLQLSAGYYADSDRSIASLDVIVGFMWHPTENVGWQIGWRQLLSWMDDGDAPQRFQFNGGVAGLYTGFVIRF